MRTHVILTAAAGDLEPSDFVFEGSEQMLIGRATGCDLRLNDLTVSRRHCLLDSGGETIWVEDLGSLNGTYLNGQRLGARTANGDSAPPAARHRELHDGDKLQVGAYAFWVRVVIEDSPEEETARPAGRELCKACA